MINITLKFNGKQIDFSEILDENELKKELQEVNLGSIDMEVEINDLPALEDALYSFKIETIDDLVRLYQIINNLNELDDEDLIKVDYLIYSGNSIEDALFDYNTIDVFEGTLEEFAEHLLEERLGTEDYNWIVSYIDFDKLTKDLEIDGYTEYNGRVFYC